MAGEVTVDALPYIDQGYDDPGVRESVSFLGIFSQIVCERNVSQNNRV